MRPSNGPIYVATCARMPDTTTKMKTAIREAGRGHAPPQRTQQAPQTDRHTVTHTSPSALLVILSPAALSSVPSPSGTVTSPLLLPSSLPPPTAIPVRKAPQLLLSTSEPPWGHKESTPKPPLSPPPPPYFHPRTSTSELQLQPAVTKPKAYTPSRPAPSSPTIQKHTLNKKDPLPLNMNDLYPFPTLTIRKYFEPSLAASAACPPV